MNILDKIILEKKKEVAARKSQITEEQLRAMPLFGRVCPSFADSLKSHPFGIISEFKRQSPSKGLINGTAKPFDTAKGYENAGAAAISCLTDEQFFGGTLADLEQVRSAVEIPVLRKEFIVDEFQILEAKAYGADIILLIAAALTVEECHRFARYAKSLGLNTLLEVHDKDELLSYQNEDMDVVGVNNRNLKTFKTDYRQSLELLPFFPEGTVKISESGLHDEEQLKELKAAGFNGFLIGENFMKTDDPSKAIQDFMNGLV
ncbi:indole-3-glycerol phosphate synthase TrpC [Persicobacter psychrovividus]|uniref:Indole-3-glycerol phosphate synthase n=1 Tax=Persicobacter psychrovividus TaxID=387638 RepID=A0ABN6LCR7_9BACT|nr:indole-3-glycerol phosphate synthase [Persicobacter psychrovividus]